MSTAFAQDLIASMTEAATHVRGEPTSAREHVTEVPDAAREALKAA